MRAILLIGFLALLPCPAAAQMPPLAGALEISVPDEVGVAADGTPTQVMVNWTYTDREPAQTALMAANQTRIEWPVPTCAAAGLAVTGPAVTYIAADPSGAGQPRRGTVAFNISAAPEAPGETPVACTFQATAVSGPAFRTAAAKPVQTHAEVAYRGELRVTPLERSLSSGPQRHIQFKLEVENLGNAVTSVRFDLVGTPSAGWNPLPPNQIILESPNQGGTLTKKTVDFVVSTPYHNGYVEGSDNFTLRVWPVSTRSADLQGEAHLVSFDAAVDGWYIPGPGPAVAIAAIAVAALAVRRGARTR